ncbi:MAG: zinc-binding dehydrogenase [Candidatus Latescibacteria bacterium]|nr:zinc-binding dehydrogenase [Candidatus Latescibacterota bacterium]
MKRVAKPAGRFNIAIEETERPRLAPTEVLIRAECSLISRGSEIWRRYAREEAIDPRMMGYSLAGRIVEVGAQVREFAPGDRVAALAPHAEYAAMEVVAPAHRPSVVRLPAGVSAEAGTFWPLATSSVLWMEELRAQPGDPVVILGQGLVGSGCMQILRVLTGARVLAVDALPPRCALARSLGADAVVDASTEDPVAAVRQLTGGEGAQAVVEAVGGRAGAAAFAQAQDMLRRGGLLQVLGLYEDEPLPLDSAKIQGRRLVGGYLDPDQRPRASDRALQLLADGQLQAAQMITHRFPFAEAAAAFDLLYHHPGETLGVLLVWD